MGATESNVRGNERSYTKLDPGPYLRSKHVKLLEKRLCVHANRERPTPSGYVYTPAREVTGTMSICGPHFEANSHGALFRKSRISTSVASAKNAIEIRGEGRICVMSKTMRTSGDRSESGLDILRTGVDCAKMRPAFNRDMLEV
jgi:hypothetical protein